MPHPNHLYFSEETWSRLLPERRRHALGAIIKRTLASLSFQSKKVWRIPFRVLRYQHVCRPSNYPAPLKLDSFVTPEAFQVQMEILAKHYKVSPLADLVDIVVNGGTPAPKSIALSFDYGFSDFYLNAYPVLSHLGLPATLMLATDYIESDDLLLRDRLALAFLARKEKGLTYPDFPELGKFAEIDISGLEVTLENLAEFIEELFNLPPDLQGLALDDLADSLGSELAELPSLTVFMSWEELREVGERGITFGSLGSGAKPLSAISQGEVASDLRAAHLALSEQGFGPLGVVATAEGEITTELASFLHDLGVRASLSSGTYPGVERTLIASLLPRVSVNALNAGSRAAFRNLVDRGRS